MPVTVVPYQRTFPVMLLIVPRRAPGLRREELAILSGISVDYVIQLEQGRAVNPSAPVVAALARAMRLGPGDAATLYRSAGLAAPATAVDRSVPDGIARLLARTRAWPAAAFTADWWLVEWNSAWSSLMGDPMQLSGRTRNQAWYEMTHDTSGLWVDADEREQFRAALVADLRAARFAHPDDAELAQLVDELHSVSEEFARRWRDARPAMYRGARKTVGNERVGPIRVTGDVFVAPGSDVRLVIYSAEPGSRDERLLAAALAPHPGSESTPRPAVGSVDARG